MAKSKSKAAEGYASNYKANKKWESNRKKRLERTLKKQPTNQQVIDALKGGMVYRRKTPSTRVWSASWIRVAKLFKEFEGYFSKDVMSANPETARNALQRQSKVSQEIVRCKVKKVPYEFEKNFFSLEARLQGIKA